MNFSIRTVYAQLRNIAMYGGHDEYHMVEIHATRVYDSRRTYVISPPQPIQAIRLIGQHGGTDYMVICEIELYRQEGKESIPFRSFIMVNLDARL